MYIQTEPALRELCDGIRDEGRFGLDTEFISEDTYYPRLGIIQASIEKRSAIIDPRSIEDLGPFLELLSDPKIETIFHAGEQDMHILQRISGKAPRNILDCQVAAAMLGHGGSISYARLVERLMDVRLGKGETLTDWTKPKLSEAQIKYALEDVRYLLPVWAKLRSELESRGRLEWLREEMQWLETKETYRLREPRLAYLNVKGHGGLRRRQLAVLRELADWREVKARTLDVPRGRILRDPAMVTLAVRSPTNTGALRSIRLMRHDTIKKYGQEIVGAARKGLEVPKGEWPEPPPRGDEPVDDTGVLDLLQAVLRSRASGLRIAPTLIATRADLVALIRRQRCSLSGGWRKSLVAEDLQRVLDGKTRVGVDDSGRNVRLY